MPAALRRRENEAAVFDGAGAQQHMPMCFAGDLGEGGRRGQKLGAGARKRFILLRKANVVAGRDAEAAPGKHCNEGALAGHEGGRLPVALAGRKIDIEHVDFIVPAYGIAVGREKECPVGGAALPDLDS